MEAPTPPRLEDFGLTPAQYDELAGRRFPAFDSLMSSSTDDAQCGLARFTRSGWSVASVMFICVVFAAAKVYLAGQGVIAAVVFGVFGGVLIGFFAVLFGMATVVPLVRAAYLQFARLRYAGFRQLERFEAAQKEFRAKQAAYEQWRIRTQAAFWRGLDGHAFEREVARLFRAEGYTVQMTPTTSDGGVDLILTKSGRKTVVQCKARTERIGVSVGRELAASTRDFGAHDAILVCVEGVTLPLQEYAEQHGIRVLDIRHLLALQLGSSQPVNIPADDPREMLQRLRRARRERSKRRQFANGT